MHRLDEARVTQRSYPFLPRINVAQPTFTGVTMGVTV
jgi:hypothetical protein